MDYYYINKKDLNSNYFHFTDRKNLKSIKSKGLVPNIGNNAKNIEKTKKVFFVEGLDNLVILFDCWINALYYIPVIPFIYKLGAFFLRHKWFPNKYIFGLDKLISSGIPYSSAIEQII